MDFGNYFENEVLKSAVFRLLCFALKLTRNTWKLEKRIIRGFCEHFCSVFAENETFEIFEDEKSWRRLEKIELKANTKFYEVLEFISDRHCEISERLTFYRANLKKIICKNCLICKICKNIVKF